MPVGHYDRTRIPRRGRPGYLLARVLGGDTDRDWQKRAACRIDDPNPTPQQIREHADKFFPVSGRSHRDKRRYEKQLEEAKRICATCPVTRECEEYRATLADENGIWGGRGEEDRDTPRRSLTAAAYGFGVYESNRIDQAHQ